MSLAEPGAAGATGPGIGSVLPAEPEEAAVADEPEEAAVAESAVPVIWKYAMCICLSYA